MEFVDLQKTSLAEVEIDGQMALFTDLRIEKSSVPEGLFLYELRHGEDDSYPAAIEESVRVNYFGAVLMTDKKEMGEEGYKPLEYETFAYTGEKLDVEEYLANYGEQEPEYISSPEALVEFLDNYDILLHMTNKEANVLLGYIEGHDFLLGKVGETLYRGDLCYEQEKIRWTKRSIDDVIEDVCNWNYDILQEPGYHIENPDNMEEKESRYLSLQADEKVLDALFDRTKYGKQLDAMAERLAGAFLDSIKKSGDIDKAVIQLVGGITDNTDKIKEKEINTENLVFEYQGYHFQPVRQFTEEENFFEITHHLSRDMELGMMEKGYHEKQKLEYSHEAFYQVSTDKTADIFQCIENGKLYVPCEHEIQQYLVEPLKVQQGKAR